MGDKVYASNFKQSLALAKQGDVFGQTSTGSCYFFGRGVEKNWKKAEEWYIKASKAGTSKECVEAQHNLCYIYQNGGYGVTKNLKKALEWLKIAEKNKGLTPHMLADICFSIGSIYSTEEGLSYGIPPDPDQAEEYFLKAIATGSCPQACYSLGRMYCLSSDETQRKDSIRYFQLGADAGHAQSMFMLGQAYLSGLNAPVNFNLAEQWTEKCHAICKEPYVIEQLETLRLLQRKKKEDMAKEANCQYIYKCTNCGTPDNQKKLMLCSKCKLVRYCSRECQTSHWKIHKPNCKAPLSTNTPLPTSKNSVPKTAADYKYWVASVDGKRSYVADKFIYFLTDNSTPATNLYFLLGQNCKAVKSDKLFLKTEFGEDPVLGNDTLAECNLLNWNVVFMCPFCNTKCKHGHLSGQIMLRRNTDRKDPVQKVTVRAIPRLWHFQCITPLIQAIVEPKWQYPLEQCRTVGVEESWAMGDRDVQEIVASIIGDMYEVGESLKKK